ncbi:hypothetical protein SERLA73DRAFT_116526 [Serpula lacrymans var. lacrymans S7.3]|uniref:Coenzyme Q-binding protein COQ10 START domain-containing protein n=1 Tax=Serpula lacrymans var. lacrymans (strain S7.3) TaxID=936435 RepID=F8QFB9_SERL3|nr:hypothetical protein SERLA73DRAFT_116526 [Serpula lacrymans var. lacrymans S7.3]
MPRVLPPNVRSIGSTYSRRLFFTIPNFSSLSPFPDSNGSNDTQTYHEQKLFPFRRRQLYDIVADVQSYHRFVPYCTSSRILERRVAKSPVIEMDAELTVGFLAFKESYISKVTCKPYESVEAVASSSTPLFKTLTTTWRFHSASSTSEGKPRSTSTALDDSEPTLVTLDLAFAFSNPLHAAVSTTFFGQVSKLMVKAFEDRCIAVYGPRS